MWESHYLRLGSTMGEPIKWMPVWDLRPGMRGVNCSVIVLEKGM